MIDPSAALIVIPIILMALSITVYYINRRSLTNRLFALFLFVGFWWQILGFIFYTDASLLHRLLPVQMGTGSFLGAIFYLFARAFVNEAYRIKRRDLLVFIPSVAVAAACVVMEISPELFDGFSLTAAIVDGRLVRKPSAIYTFYTIVLIFGFLAGFIILVRGLMTETNVDALRRIGTILFSLVFGITGALVMTNLLTLLGLGGYDRYALVFIFIGILGISFTVLRHRAWTVEHLLDIIAERNREMEDELETARLLQRRLLPAGELKIPGCRFGATYIPMDKVGGDFYDHSSSGGKIRLFIADVSGHGLPGAFLATVTKVALDKVSDRDSAGNVLMQLNESIFRATVNNNFVTAFFCTIDLEKRTMRYCSAGHLPQFLFRKSSGTCVELKTTGMPMGWFANLMLEEDECSLEPGDRLVLYTDGIVECANGSREFYGEERLLSFIGTHHDDTPREFLNRLIDDLREFSGDEKFQDDITCVVLDLPGR